VNKTWTIIEKIIGVLLSVWGIIALYGVASAILNISHSGYALMNHISYFDLLLKNHVNFLLALAAIFSGFLLLFNDKEGWLLCVICSALYVVTFITSSQASSTDKSKPYFEFSKSYSLMALLFLVMLILLVQKPFLKKYHVTFKNWFWIIAIVVLVIADKLFLK
jgi:hypothetical protein